MSKPKQPEKQTVEYTCMSCRVPLTNENLHQLGDGTLLCTDCFNAQIGAPEPDYEQD